MRARPTSRGRARFVAFLIVEGYKARRTAHEQGPSGLCCNQGELRGSKRDS